MEKISNIFQREIRIIFKWEHLKHEGPITSNQDPSTTNTEQNEWEIVSGAQNEENDTSVQNEILLNNRTDEDEYTPEIFIQGYSNPPGDNDCFMNVILVILEIIPEIAEKFTSEELPSINSSTIDSVELEKRKINRKVFNELKKNIQNKDWEKRNLKMLLDVAGGESGNYTQQDCCVTFVMLFLYF